MMDNILKWSSFPYTYKVGGGYMDYSKQDNNLASMYNTIRILRTNMIFELERG